LGIFEFAILLVSSYCFCIKKLQQVGKNKLLSFFICCRMAHPQKKLKCQGKVTTDNQQVNVVANEEEIEVEQRILIYTPIFESKP
jgi:hypothetical protein